MQQTCLKAESRAGGRTAWVVMSRDEDAGLQDLEKPYTFCPLGIHSLAKPRTETMMDKTKGKVLLLWSLGVAIHGWAGGSIESSGIQVPFLSSSVLGSWLISSTLPYSPGWWLEFQLSRSSSRQESGNGREGQERWRPVSFCPILWSLSWNPTNLHLIGHS